MLSRVLGDRPSVADMKSYFFGQLQGLSVGGIVHPGVYHVYYTRFISPIQHILAVFIELLKVKVAMGVDYSL